MKKGLVLVLGFFLISASLSFARGARVAPVTFTLAETGGNPAPIPFTLAPPSTGSSSLASLRGSAFIEDPGWPFLTALGGGAYADIYEGGEGNTAIGFGAIGTGYGPNYCTATGFAALSVCYGSRSTATGANALATSKGDYNTAVGSNALEHCEGGNNTAVGYNALNDNDQGSLNTAVGVNAIAFNFLGLGNTAVGASALENLGHDNGYNTALGYRAGASVLVGPTTLPVYYNIFIGANQVGVLGDNRTIRIGLPYNASENPPVGQNRTFIAGIVESPLGAELSPAVVGITSEGRLGTFPSELLPQGPQGPQGIQGPPGPVGEGLVPGSLLFLLPGIAPPAGYASLGSTELALTVPGVKKPTRLTVNVYQKQ